MKRNVILIILCLAIIIISLISFTYIIETKKKNESHNIERVGNYKKRVRGLFALSIPYGLTALYIPRSEYPKLGIIQNLRFFIGDKGIPSKRFQTWIMTKNPITNHPEYQGSPDKGIFVQSDVADAWFVVDVSKYKIQTPQDGFFIVMAWFTGVNKNEINPRIMSSQYLGYSDIVDSVRTWYTGIDAQQWYQLPKYEKNAMMAADIKILEE
jgi:hypothetical protein